jgi:hypothetical protein
MKKLVVALGFLVAAMSTVLSQRYVDPDLPYGFSFGGRPEIIKVNAPGGGYIQCDARIAQLDGLPRAGR